MPIYKRKALLNNGATARQRCRRFASLAAAACAAIAAPRAPGQGVPIGRQGQGFTRARVPQLQRMGVQPQALAAQALRPPAVELPFAMGGIAQDGVGHMLEMAANLVAAARVRLGQHQAGVGAGWRGS